MSNDRANQLVANLTIAALAVILVGGSVAGWLLGKQIPGWLENADIAIIVAAFGSGAFFVQARTAAPTAVLASQIQDDHHELVMSMARAMPSMTISGITSEDAPQGSEPG